MKKIILLGSIFVGSFFLTDCKKPNAESGQMTPNNGTGEVELSVNTKVVSADENKNLQSLDDTKLVFNTETSFLNTIKVGDILASGPSEIARHGYLRMVTKIENNENLFTFSTDQASLEDAVKNANIHVEAPLEVNVDESVVSNQRSSHKTTGSVGNFLKKIIINHMLHDGDARSSTTFDQVSTTGSVSITATMSMDINIQNHKLIYFNTSTDFNVNQNQDLTVGGTLGVIGEKTIFTAPLPNVTFPIGVLPVVIKPSFEVALGYEVAVTGKITIGCTSLIRSKPSIIFQNNNWRYDYLRNFSATRHPIQGNATSAQVTGSVIPKVVFSLYGCTCSKAWVQGEAYVAVEVKPNTTTKLKGGVRGGAGAFLFGYRPSNNSIFNFPVNI